MSRVPLLIAALLLVPGGCRQAPDPGPAPHQIHIVGSSAAYPFSTYVAERLTRERADAIAPLVRAGGSGEGVAFFCDGLGRAHPDLVVTDREMTPTETTRCAADGITHIARIPIGFTAFVPVIATGSADWSLTRALLYRAMTSEARIWSDLDPALPARAIRIKGPSPDPAIADGLFDRILTPGCKAAGGDGCDVPSIRRDGAYTSHGANADLIAEAVATTPGAIGIVPYAQAIAHRDVLRILPLDGIAATPATIASGRYPASAPLLLFAKADELAAVADLPRLLGYYADALAPGGEFARRGLVPLPDTARGDARSRLAAFQKP